MNNKLGASATDYWRDKQDAYHRHSDEIWLSKYAEELLALLPKRGTLVDVGCGTCQLTTSLASAYDEVIGFDSSASMLKEGRQRLIQHRVNNVLLTQGDATRFPKEVANVDAILVNGVLQYLDREAMKEHLSECLRVLSPRGTILWGLIPDARLRHMWYAGALSTQQRTWYAKALIWLSTMRSLMAARAKGDILWDGIGRWFWPHEIQELAAEQGLSCQLVHAWYYEYRFHAILRRSN